MVLTDETISTLSFRATPPVKRAVEANARTLGICVSEFMRRAASDPGGVAILLAEERQRRQQLSTEGAQR